METQLIEKLDPIAIAGIRVRTNNKEEMTHRAKSPGFWQRFMNEQIPSKLPNAVGSEVYALYYNYESDSDGDYTLLLGVRVESLDIVPEGMTGILIPGGKYLKCTSEKGSIPQIVYKVWDEVWDREGTFTEGKRAFSYDFELYDERAASEDGAQIDIYLSLK